MKKFKKQLKAMLEREGWVVWTNQDKDFDGPNDIGDNTFVVCGEGPEDSYYFEIKKVEL